MANGNAAGDFFGLSTIDSISQYGRDLSDREKIRLALRNKREDTALAVQTRPRQQLGMGVTMDSSGKSYRSDKYGEALDEQQANKMAIAQAKLQQQATKLAEQRTYDESKAKKAKPTGSALKAYQGSEVLQRQMADSIEIYDAMSPDTQEDTSSPYTDVALSFLDDDVARLIQEKVVYDKPEVKKIRSKIAKIESDFSKVMSGLQVTGYELKDRQRWSPFANAIDAEERKQRLVNLQEDLSNEQDVFEKLYPGYGFPDDETTEDTEAVKMVQPEPVQQQPQQSAADRIAAIKKRLSRK